MSSKENTVMNTKQVVSEYFYVKADLTPVINNVRDLISEISEKRHLYRQPFEKDIYKIIEFEEQQQA